MAGESAPSTNSVAALVNVSSPGILQKIFFNIYSYYAKVHLIFGKKFTPVCHRNL